MIRHLALSIIALLTLHIGAAAQTDSEVKPADKRKLSKAEANLVRGRQFLEENGKKPGVVKTLSGLQYEVIRQGEGKRPTDASAVTVHYTGSLTNGKVFESTVEEGEPAVFQVGEVIMGFQEVLKLMPAGSRYRVFIPAELAYGDAGAGKKVGPNETLVFEMELIAVE